jgi:hypothetical protein
MTALWAEEVETDGAGFRALGANAMADCLAWAKQQNDKPSRSEAIRRLLEFALAFKAKKRGSNEK